MWSAAAQASCLLAWRGGRRWLAGTVQHVMGPGLTMNSAMSPPGVPNSGSSERESTKRRGCVHAGREWWAAGGCASQAGRQAGGRARWHAQTGRRLQALLWQPGRPEHAGSPHDMEMEVARVLRKVFLLMLVLKNACT